MSFYVTLPSNTTSPSFTTNLGRQIELKGVYEVGLVEFSYTQEIELDLGSSLASSILRLTIFE